MADTLKRFNAKHLFNLFSPITVTCQKIEIYATRYCIAPANILTLPAQLAKRHLLQSFKKAAEYNRRQLNKLYLTTYKHIFQMKKLAKWILGRMGWRIVGGMPEGISKAVIIMAPHTSNWDFVYGRLGFAQHGVKVNVIIKKESFFFPLGYILKALGGIPVDRGISTSTIKRITRIIDQNEHFFLLITPEGTRKLVKNWKKGFYFIAIQSKVPIVLGYLDYKTKTGGLGHVLYPSGDYEADMKIIEDFYRDKQPRHPQKFNLSAIPQA